MKLQHLMPPPPKGGSEDDAAAQVGLQRFVTLRPGKGFVAWQTPAATCIPRPVVNRAAEAPGCCREFDAWVDHSSLPPLWQAAMDRAAKQELHPATVEIERRTFAR